jgi:hypothetical protein
MSEGLRPMNRQYVHLSTDEKTAVEVGKRKINNNNPKEEKPVMIAICTIEAYNTGVYHFYQATDSVWLTDYVHPNNASIIIISIIAVSVKDRVVDIYITVYKQYIILVIYQDPIRKLHSQRHVSFVFLF